MPKNNIGAQTDQQHAFYQRTFHIRPSSLGTLGIVSDLIW